MKLSNGIEYRYVSGILLTENKKVDLSGIEIDKELNKLSTIKLLKMYKSSLKSGKYRLVYFLNCKLSLHF